MQSIQIHVGNEIHCVDAVLPPGLTAEGLRSLIESHLRNTIDSETLQLRSDDSFNTTPASAEPFVDLTDDNLQKSCEEVAACGDVLVLRGYPAISPVRTPNNLHEGILDAKLPTYQQHQEQQRLTRQNSTTSSCGGESAGVAGGIMAETLGDMEVAPTAEGEQDGTWHLAMSLRSGSENAVVVALTAVSQLCLARKKRGSGLKHQHSYSNLLKENSSGSHTNKFSDSSIHAVVHALRSMATSPQIVLHALVALWNMTLTKESQLTALSMGCVPDVLAAWVRHGEDPFIVRAACGALSNVALRKQGTEDIIFYGGVGLCVKSLGCMAHNPSELARLYSLLECVVYNDPSTVTTMTSTLEPIITYMGEHIDLHYAEHPAVLSRIFLLAHTLTACWRCLKSGCTGKDKAKCLRRTSLAAKIACDLLEAERVKKLLIDVDFTHEAVVPLGLVMLTRGLVAHHRLMNSSNGSNSSSKKKSHHHNAASVSSSQPPLEEVLERICNAWLRRTAARPGERITFNSALTVISVIAHLYAGGAPVVVERSRLWFAAINVTRTTFMCDPASAVQAAALISIVVAARPRVLVESSSLVYAAHVLTEMAYAHRSQERVRKGVVSALANVRQRAALEVGRGGGADDDEFAKYDEAENVVKKFESAFDCTIP